MIIIEALILMITFGPIGAICAKVVLERTENGSK